MLILFVGSVFALVLSFVSGLQTSSTCARGWLNVSCDAGKVILIKQVFRGSYINGVQRCSYQSGDGREYDVGITQLVWKDCNLRSKCDVRFTDTGNYYLQMDYDCVSKNGMNMTSVCNGTMKADHGYIHSPCYPNMATLQGPNAIFCKCTASVPTQTLITVKIFHAFLSQESLVIYWNSSNAQLINQGSDSYKEVHDQHSGPFSISFSSAFEGTDWDRSFWLEYTANSEINMQCTRVTGTSASTTSQIPPPESATSTTTTTTSTLSLSTSTNGIIQPIQSSTTERTIGPGGSNGLGSSIVIGVILAVSMVLNIILTILLLLRMGIFACSCKGRAGDRTVDEVNQVQLENGPALHLEAPSAYENVGTNNENVNGLGIVNTAFNDIQDSEANGNLVTNDDVVYANVSATAADTNGSRGTTRGRAGTYENVGSNDEIDAVGDALPDDSAYQEVMGNDDGGVSSQVVDPGQRELDSTYASLGTFDRPEYMDLRQAHYNITK